MESHWLGAGVTSACPPWASPCVVSLSQRRSGSGWRRRLLTALPAWVSAARDGRRGGAHLPRLPSAAGPVPVRMQQPHRRLPHGPGSQLPATPVSAWPDWRGGPPAGRGRWRCRSWCLCSGRLARGVGAGPGAIRLT